MDNNNNNNLNQESFDLFAQLLEGDERQEAKVCIRCLRRNGRQLITSIHGLVLTGNWNIHRLARAMKKTFECYGSVRDGIEDEGEIIVLSGDQRLNVRMYLIDKEICHEDQIFIQGA